MKTLIRTMAAAGLLTSQAAIADEVPGSWEVGATAQSTLRGSAFSVGGGDWSIGHTLDLGVTAGHRLDPNLTIEVAARYGHETEDGSARDVSGEAHLASLMGGIRAETDSTFAPFAALHLGYAYAETSKSFDESYGREAFGQHVDSTVNAVAADAQLGLRLKLGPVAAGAFLVWEQALLAFGNTDSRVFGGRTDSPQVAGRADPAPEFMGLGLGLSLVLVL